MSITKSETSTLEELDFKHIIPCEGGGHKRGILGHVASEPGAFYIVAPCCGPKIVCCRSRYDKLHVDGLLNCGTCGRQYLIERFKFIPID